MTEKHSASIPVLPNTLRDEMAPNTFRAGIGSGTAASNQAATSDIPTVSLGILTRPRLPGWLSSTVIAFAVIIAAYWLLSTT